MPYNLHRNMLFIHIPKNAGKAIEKAIGGIYPDTGSRSLLNRLSTGFQRLTVNKDSGVSLHGTLDISLCAQHLTLQEIKLLGLIPCDKFDSAFKFAICRNPWDRAVSTYHHFHQNRRLDSEPISFNAYWEAWEEIEIKDHNQRAHHRTQASFVRNIQGVVDLDLLMRFECLSDDYKKLKSRFTDLGDLEKVGSAVRRKSSYRDYYDDNTRNLVGKIFEEDVDLFNYQF